MVEEMRVEFHRDLDEIDQKVLQLFALVAEGVGKATDAFLARIQKENWQASYFGDDMLPLPGGVPLKDASGTIVGTRSSPNRSVRRVRTRQAASPQRTRRIRNAFSTTSPGVPAQATESSSRVSSPG